MTTTEQLKKIVPGKTYTTGVVITETTGEVVKFCMNSFFVGMYCAIYVNGRLATQAGDHDNKGFTRKLKRDIVKAMDRGAKVEIDSIFPVKSLED